MATQGKRRDDRNANLGSMIEPFDRPFNEGSPTPDEVCGRDAKCKSLKAVEDWWFVSDDLVGLHFCAAKLTHSRIHRRDNRGEPRLLLHSHPDAPEPALVLELSDETQAVTWCELLYCIA
jgi:hypothetical protein